MRIWKYSCRDAFPLAVSAGFMALNIWLAATWTEHAALEIVLLWPAAVALFWYNAMVATHNFLHTPWFGWESANRVFAALNSINLGVPQILCWFHHLNHHRHGNDRQGADGRTKDHSSTYRFGGAGHHERLLSYCALGFFRSGMLEAFRETRRTGHRRELLFQLVVCGAGLAGYLYLSWQYVLLFFVPMFNVGAVLGIMTNYYQHVGAAPENRWSNSVSYYGRLYNLLFCNEGYHQEHHLYPQLHWTRRPEVLRMLPTAGRVVSKVPPLFALFERRRRLVSAPLAGATSPGPVGGTARIRERRGAGGRRSAPAPILRGPEAPSLSQSA